MTDPRTLAATVVNQIYTLHKVPMGGPMYHDMVKAFAHALDYHAQENALQRQMERLVVFEDETPIIVSDGNGTIN